jgi:hypothetical protein
MRCPVCGRGTLVDVVFDSRDPAGDEPEPAPQQRAESGETDLYSCGHEVRGAPLSTANADLLAVERRRSEETVDPVPDEEDPRS